MAAKRLAKIYLVFFSAFLSIMLSSSLFSGERDIRLENRSEFISDRQYEWTVYVVAEEPILDEIDYVEYILHPSFPEPIRIAKRREDNFSFSASAWGEFLIRATVVFKNGDIIPVEHWLRLEAHRTPIEERGLAVENTADYIREEDLWEWTIYIASGDDVLEQIECVQYVLHPSYPNPVREICEKGSIAGAGFMLIEMSRKPFDISVEIRFRDGQTRFLEHRLWIPTKGEEYQLVALQSTQNESYIRAGVGGESYLAAVSEHIKGWEIFEFIRLDENKVALRSIQNHRYICAGVGDVNFLAATSGRIMGWETFRLFQLEDNMIALQSIQNNRFVRAGVGKDAYLAASSVYIKGWEMFRLIYLGEEGR